MDRFSRSSYEPNFPAWPPERGLVDRDERHVSLYRVGALTVAGRRELCVVRNVSTGGLMLTAYSPIEPGARIAVEFKQGEPVQGIVAWSDSSSVGVRFDEAVDVAAILANPAEGLRPRMPRIGIESRITVREGDALHEVRALDISQGGVCIESSARLAIGADVVVRLEGLPPEGAVVRWRNGDCYGLGFNRLLSVPSLAAWLREHRDGGSGKASA